MTWSGTIDDRGGACRVVVLVWFNASALGGLCCSTLRRLARLLVSFDASALGLCVSYDTPVVGSLCLRVSFNTLAWACWPIRVVLGEPSSVVVIKEGMV